VCGLNLLVDVAEPRRRAVRARMWRAAVRWVDPPVAQGQGPVRQVPDTLLHEFRYALLHGSIELMSEGNHFESVLKPVVPIFTP
jgi:hypothetical protein